MTILSLSLRLVLFTLCLTICAATAQADVKIKSKSTSGGHTTEHTVYIKGKRQRTEHNPAIVSIMQCDLRRTIDLGVPTQTYMISPFDQNTDATAPTNASATRTAQPSATTTTPQRGGLITTTITTTDTGERKQMFGYTARRIKSVMVTESSPEACQPTRSRMEMDGWYIDAAFALDCGDMNAAAYVPQARPDGCRDQYRMKQVGAARTGYPVAVTTTMFDEQGKSSFTWTQEVVEISKAVLEDALFDVPAGYREVRDRQEMLSASAMMSSMSNDTNADDDDATEAGNHPARNIAQGTGGGMAASVRTQANAQPASATVLGAKRAGVMRIGVVATTTGAVGEGINSVMLGEAVRSTLINYLTGPTIEVVALEARLPQQADVEAKQKECDFVLYSTVAHKKGGGGGFGGFLRKAAPVVNVVPMGSGTSSVVADVAVRTTVYTTADLAASVKAKDELTFDYQLRRAVDGSAVVGQTLKAKAKSDGDDLVSQLVEQAAAAVLTGAARR